MDKVLWKPIEGYVGLYEVSSDGRVRSLNYGGIKGRVGELVPYDAGKGYLRVDLYLNSTPKKHKVHRLVAGAFIPNPNNYPQINHIDENKSNNSISNLEWCTAKYNMNYGTRSMRGAAKAALSNLNGKLSKPVKALDKTSLQIIHTFPSMMEAHRQGFDCGQISKCCRDYQMSHKGLFWRYV